MKNLQEAILQNLEIDALNPMQIDARKSIVKHHDVLLLSPTGSGKTVAFLLPLLELLDQNSSKVQCLILVPSRELALQIQQVWKKMGTNYKVNVCYGGHSIETEFKNLSNPPAVLIGTPGRIADHIERNSFDSTSITTLILDEFDKSLQLGFHEQMSFIVNRLISIQKRILVSATENIEMPRFIRVKSPHVLDYVPKFDAPTNLTVKHIHSADKDKIETLATLITTLNSEPAIIFCNHRDAVERVSELLNEKGIFTTYYHGGMDQEERERALIFFRNGSVRYLITTDLAARGLDIPEMQHVIHYHLPIKEEEFTHRNGRTARMLSSGTAYIMLHETDKKPEYITDGKLVTLKSGKLPKAPDYKTLYISGGKKNKLNKIDIVGFFTNIGKLQKDEIGLIEVKDFISFVAVKADKIQNLLQTISDQKMKGKKYKIAIARNVVKNEDDKR